MTIQITTAQIAIATTGVAVQVAKGILAGAYFDVGLEKIMVSGRIQGGAKMRKK